MSEAPPPSFGRRVLVLAPTGRDARLTRSVLAEVGIRSTPCESLAALAREMAQGAGALLLSEEAVMSESDMFFLGERLARQPPWSDLPVLLLAHTGADSAAVRKAIRALGNVTLLERPVRVASLVSTVQTALRARARQYHAREHLQELDEADRRKDEFIATLAHELRNPLAPIRNSLHIVRMAGSQDSAIQRVAAMMERQVQHMVRMVDDLLEVSRISRGKIELRRERVRLADVLRSAVDTSRPLIEAGGHDLRLRLPEESVAVDGDPVRLAQVFANLLNNSAKYTSMGGRIEVNVSIADGAARICVKDNGEGIPPAMLDKVFNMFTQVDAGNRAQGGLGIGLTLARTLVHLHGGTIEARSEGRGMGCEFLIRLPLAAEDTPEAAASAAAPSRHGNGKLRRVLVVDDNHDAADSLGMLLQFLGAETMTVHDGHACLDAVQTFKPAVVLLDLGMPGMSGLEVARRLRADPDLGETTLVALTGWGQREDRRRTQEAGFDYHLVKPADLSTLQSILSMRDDEAQRPAPHR